VQRHLPELLALFAAVRAAESFSPRKLNALAVRHIHDGDMPVPQAGIIKAYEELAAQGVIPFERKILERLRLKPTRTVSGVAPVAVLTGPYPCPADCIFCPEVKGYPRSYLPDEPAVQRAKRARFDPFEETRARITALENMGHSTDKIELLVIGATWSAYPHRYQEWFIRRCLEAMNGRESGTLAEAQAANESAAHRSVGLVIETRPDYITLDEVRRLRRLGVTKVQLGAQSTDDAILAANRRGHTIADTRRAVRMLRLAGFKLHLHWMPNLLGATPESDLEDFRHLWADPALRPDELKIYPCSVIEGTELHRRWQQGEFRPYTDEELIELLVAAKSIVPAYCRINRIIRDIPAHYIVAGSTQSHMRQTIQREMRARGLRCGCIRCREVRAERLDAEQLQLETTSYRTDATTEYFVSLVTPAGRSSQDFGTAVHATGSREPAGRSFSPFGPEGERPAVSPPTPQGIDFGTAVHATGSREPAGRSSQDFGTAVHATGSREPAGKLAGFLRLSLPAPDAPRDEMLEELTGCAIVREVHVFGPALEIGVASSGEAQHAGLGRRLAEEAMRIARSAGYRRLAVIASTGTREYYRKLGFELGELYMARSI
jgi:elongator complex protein 3